MKTEKYISAGKTLLKYCYEEGEGYYWDAGILIRKDCTSGNILYFHENGKISKKIYPSGKIFEYDENGKLGVMWHGDLARFYRNGIIVREEVLWRK